MKFRETAGDGREDVWPGPHVANVSILGQPHVLEREAAESRPVPEYEVDEVLPQTIQLARDRS